jgi:hypothetical protein
MNIEQERYDYIEKKLNDKLCEFRTKIAEIGNEVLGDLYSDVLPHIASDTEFNISNRVQKSISNLLEGEFKDISTDRLKPYIQVSDGYGMNSYIHLSQYNKMCNNIYEVCKDNIHNNIIENLKQEVVQLKEQLTRSYSRGY